MLAALLLSFAVQDELAGRAYRVDGPAIACGQRFALTLLPGEAMSWSDMKMDFLVYRVARGERTTIVYEGDAPQPGGVVIRTGRQGWPSVVSVHGDAAVARRVSTSRRLLGRCATPRVVARQ